MSDNNPTPKSKIIIIGIILSFASQIVSLFLASFFFIQANSYYSNLETIFIISRLLLWLCLVMIYSYSKKVEKQSLLLYKEQKYPVVFYFLSIVSLIIILYLVSFAAGFLLKLTGLYSQPSRQYERMLSMFNNNRWLMLFTVITAGIMEELMYRGYLLSRLEKIFRNKYLPVIISSVLFGLLHFGYGTVQNIVIPGLIGLVFALYYNRYRNIKIIIIAHFLYDLILISIALHYYVPKVS